MHGKTILFISLFALSSAKSSSANPENSYWHLTSPTAITWTFDGRAHTDHIEMSGQQMSAILHYGIAAEGHFTCDRHLVFPMLRTLPNDTHASFIRYISWDPLESVLIGHQRITDTPERVKDITLSNGTLCVQSHFGGLTVRRTFAPSPTLPALIEAYTIVNGNQRPTTLRIEPTIHRIESDPSKGLDGSYIVEEQITPTGTFTLNQGESLTFYAVLSARRATEPSLSCEAAEQLNQRQQLTRQWLDNLVLVTPDSILNRMFAFSKVRAAESIYQTKNGPLHGPGGERYYAAIWANDQAEYANPFFPFLGYAYANASAMNSWRMFASYLNEDYHPIPSSIIAEGTDYWNGAGDRGDAAMIAYGASRYALARGSRQEAETLWPLITWTLEYCRRQLNADGVVMSNCDELEGRFPAGEANLCTSSLYYDALRSAAFLARDLGKGKALAKTYNQQADALRIAIDRFFHADMEGFDTYRYYNGNDILRSWICIPLTMGIFTRAAGTIDALYSPRLWTDNGMLTQAGSQTFWDRSTLYALRGALMAGDTARTLRYLQNYSATRLLGQHVPYAIEAWPEGNQRHLSAESALYARIITEGLFGIRPTGLRCFTVSPRLPQEWPEMRLNHIRLADADFDLRVFRDKRGRITTQLIRNQQVVQEGHGDNASFRL